MKQKIITYGVWIVFIMMTFVANSQKITPAIASNQIQITSTAPVTPVLKRILSNPLIRIRIYIPQSIREKKYQKINCTLNKSAVNNIEEIHVFFTDTEPFFDTSNLIAKISPSSTNFIIPVDFTLKPGLHYIWLSANLKDYAHINDKIELHCTGLTDADNKKVIVTEENFGYDKHIGIDLRKAGDDGVNTYRIPGITTTAKGTLIAVYDIRYNNSKDLPENIDVGMNRSKDGGQTWEPMKVIMDMGAPQENNGIGDPAILFDPVTKKIWVAALWSKGNHSIAGSIGGLSPDSTGQFMLASSDDDGITWSKPVNITAQVKDPAWKIFFQGPGNGIAMKDGNIVFPAQYWDEKNIPHSTIIYSDDHGATWKRGTGAKSNTTESTIVETTPGTLMLNMRDNRGEFRSIATTKNMGKTWIEDPTSYSALPDPVCMGSLLKAKVKVKGIMKEVLFFSNPNSSSVRSHITIKASLDQGKNWLPVNQLLIDQRKCYGYSSLTKIDDNTIGILYEGIKDLYFVPVPVSDIIK
ncbi:MAG: exo-alpha-sialidase [Ginsengibacter sp.]